MEEDTRPVYVWTSDRVVQCDYLREVAAETYGLFTTVPDIRMTGEQIVAEWEQYQKDSGSGLPDWYDAHDAHLLAGYIQDRLDAHWTKYDEEHES